jgi:predicted transposase YbfD/YdcC
VELKVAPRLLDRLALKGLVVTVDALHTQRKTARVIVGGGGDYLMVVKENQPSLYEEIELLFADPPLGEVFDRDLSRRTHGDRYEERDLLASSALAGYVDWPHVGQVCRIERRVWRKGKLRVEVAYAITSLKNAGAKKLQRLWRGHWGIENRLHWVRDVTMGEDLSQVRTKSAPQVMAALRNLTLSILRLAGVGNVAAALRRNARYPEEAMALMGLPTPRLE